MSRAIIAVVLGFLLLPGIFAATCETNSGTCYYISPSGSDTNPGTFDKPWKSFMNIISYYSAQYEPSTVVTPKPGDVIYLLDGVHSTMLSPGDGSGASGGTRAVAYFRQEHATIDNPITIKGYPGHNAIIDPQKRGMGFYILQSDGFVIEDLTFRNAYQAGIDLASCKDFIVNNVHIYDTDGWDNGNLAGLRGTTCTNLLIDNSVFHDNYDRTNEDTGGIKNQNSANMVFFNGGGGGDITVRNSEFYQTPPTSADKTGGCLKYKHASSEPGRYFNVYNNVFRNCWFFAFGTGTGNTHFHHNIIIGGDGIVDKDWGGITHQVQQTFEYNTLYYNRFWMSPAINWRNSLFPNDPQNIVFRNNIVYGPGRPVEINQYITDEVYDAIVNEIHADNNCYYNSGGSYEFGIGARNGGNYGVKGAYYSVSEWQNQFGNDVHSVFANPQFVNAGNNDFRLQSNSPCTAMGHTAGDPSNPPPPPSPTPDPTPDPVPDPTPTGPLPGMAGTPFFTTTSNGVQVTWTQATNAEAYTYTSSVGGGTTTGTTITVGLSDGDWFCVLPTNQYGNAPDSSCNTYQVLTQPPPPTTYCGDGTCDSTETCSSCSSDCGSCQPSIGSDPDVNKDTVVDIRDVILVLQNIGAANSQYDANGLSPVDIRDVIIVLQNIGTQNTPLPPIKESCDNPQPAWIWCDDFEGSNNLRERYEDVGSDNGNFYVSINDAHSGTKSVQQHYEQGQVSGGWLWKFFGKHHLTGDQGITHREIYVRWYHKFEEGFTGTPPKHARLRVFDPAQWKGAYADHYWHGNGVIVIDPVSHVNPTTNTVDTNYNDWLGAVQTNFDFNKQENIGRWICHEMHVRLNDPGTNNGKIEFYADNQLIGTKNNVDMVRSYTDYGLNGISLDTYWNEGSTKAQNRYYDDLVISTERIGCEENPQEPPPPTCTPSLEVCDGLDNDCDGSVDENNVCTPPPPIAGIPSPLSGDLVLLDTRAGGADDIQVATSVADAKTRMGSGFIRPGIEWAMDYDGAGTRAFRWPWDGVGSNWGDRTLAIERQYSLHDEIFIQWKMRMGRHVNDAGTSHGTVDGWDTTNENDPGSPNAGRKLWTWVRESDESFGRFNHIVRGPSGMTRVSSSSTGYVGSWDTSDFDRFIARVVTVTVQLRKESSVGAGDGLTRIWYDDDLVTEDLNAGTGALKFGHRIKYNSVFRSPKMDMVEYWYDFVTWSPSTP